MSSALHNTVDFLDHLNRADNEQSAGACLIQQLEQLGFHAINIWYGDSADGKIIGTCPEEWWQYMWEKQWALKTHVFLESQKSMQPIFWGADITLKDPFANEYSKLGAAVAYESYQARSAVTLPVHSFSGRYNGGVDCVTTMPQNEFYKYLDEKLLSIQSSVLLAHLRVQEFLKNSANDTPESLSPREKECVQWLAVGLRTQQIADKMAIREVTADLYIQNARRKLQARTRAHLVAKAILGRHIQL